MVSPSEAHYIIESCFSDFRIDGRSRLEHRPYTVSSSSVVPTKLKGGEGKGAPPLMTAPSPPSSSNSSLILSNGSSRIHLPGSSTDILCSVKADIVHPSPCKPREGIVELNVDLSLCGSGIGGIFDGGNGGAMQQQQRMNTSSSRRKERDSESQITSLLQRLILPHAVNYTQLAILPGKYVWRLSIDIVVLRCDGCILDACSLALRVGLSNTNIPCVKSAVMVEEKQEEEGGGIMDEFGGVGSNNNNNKNDLIVDGDIKHARPPPGVENCPLVVTVSVLSAAVRPPSSLSSSLISDNTTTTAAAAAAAAVAVAAKQQQQRQSPKRRQYISIIDARTEEEVCASSHVCVSIDPCGLICGVHTLGGSGVSEDSLASGGVHEEREKGEEVDYDNDNNTNPSSSSMPLAMLKDVVASAAMASKNLYSLLNNTNNVTDENTMVMTSENEDGNGYSYLLKNHFLIQ